MRISLSTRFIAILFMLITSNVLPIAASADIAVVPAGNRSETQPKIPKDSYSRTRSSNGSFQGKYEKIRDLIARDKKLQAGIKKSAKRFNIDPVHIVGALIGEHTYNVDAYDRLQRYAAKAATYLKESMQFQYEGEHVLKFVARPEFKKCAVYKDNYRLWDCREDVWKKTFSGKTVDGISWPRDRFSRVFFQPFYLGQTFGLGQLNPLSALQVDDIVRRKTKRRALSAKNAPKVYETIMDPESTLDYMAAILKISITSYRQIAGVDISNNPGITATLYNLGNVIDRAHALKAKRAKYPNALPQENYYGWLVNNKISELENLVK